MFVVDKVVEEDRRLLHANELESFTLPDGTTQTLGPAKRGAFVIYEELCLGGMTVLNVHSCSGCAACVFHFHEPLFHVRIRMTGLMKGESFAKMNSMGI